MHFIKRISDFKIFIKVNSNIFLRSLALILVTTFFTSASAKSGDTMLAVNSLLMQLFSFFSYMMDGFAYAAEALTGRFYGAKDFTSLQVLIKRLFMWGIGLTLLFTVVYALFADNILQILTDKENIIQATKDYQVWALLFPIAGFSAFLWDGIFIGLTASRQMRNSMFVAVVFFFIVYYLLNPLVANNALWLSFISYLAMRGIMQTLLYKSIRLKLTRLNL